MVIDLSKLTHINIDNIGVISSYMKENKCSRSAFSPVNLILWGTQFKAQWFFVDEKLVIYNEAWNCILLPCGSRFTPQLLKNISDAFYDSGRCGRVSFLDQEYVETYRDELDSFDVFIDRSNADYIYYADRLASLSGRKLAKKKNQISQFLKAYPEYKVSELTGQNFAECFQLSEKWLSDHHRQHPGYQYEKEAMKLAFKYFDRLGLSGKKLHINSDMVAFSVFSELNEDMAVVHFEKFDRDIKGSAQMINREMAKLISEKYQYINREEDMGIEQLRQAKKSYEPLAILESYGLERKKKE